MNIPDTLRYTSEHLWVQAAADGIWLAGITDYAQDLLGDIVFIDFPAIASRLIAGTPCGLIESVKTGSELHAPVDGEIVAINAELENAPEQINDAPYAAWIFKFTPDNTADIGALLDSKSYQALLAS